MTFSWQEIAEKVNGYMWIMQFIKSAIKKTCTDRETMMCQLCAVLMSTSI